MKRVKLLPIIALMFFTTPTVSLVGQGGEEQVQILPVVNAVTGDVQRMNIISFDKSGVTSKIGLFANGMKGSGVTWIANRRSSMPRPKNLWELLSSDQVQSEIGMHSGQVAQFRDARAQYETIVNNLMNDLFNGLKDGEYQPANSVNPNLMTQDSLRQFTKSLVDEQSSLLGQILLPHQVSRLEQISLHRYVKKVGLVNALSQDELVNHLGLTDEQHERLKQRNSELNKQLAKEIEKLKKEAREELIKELTKDQQRKIEELLGDPFD